MQPPLLLVEPLHHRLDKVCLLQIGIHLAEERQGPVRGGRIPREVRMCQGEVVAQPTVARRLIAHRVCACGDETPAVVAQLHARGGL